MQHQVSEAGKTTTNVVNPAAIVCGVASAMITTQRIAAAAKSAELVTKAVNFMKPLASGPGSFGTGTPQFITLLENVGDSIVHYSKVPTTGLKFLGNVAKYAPAVTTFSIAVCEIVMSSMEYWEGYLTGKELSIKIAASIAKGAATFGVGYGAGLIGSAIGTMMCPGLGTLVGAIIGAACGLVIGVGGSYAVSWVTDKIVLRVLPKPTD